MTQAGPRVKQRQMRIVGQMSTHVRLKDMYRDVYVLDTSAAKRQTQQWFSDTVTCCTFINRFVKASVIPLYAHPDSHQTKACVNTFTPHAAPHPSARLQPCQIAHIRNTFSHSFLSPLATSSALASASLLCSRKTWTAQSISLHLRLTALLHHSRSCFEISSCIPADFCLAVPLIQSTTVLLSLLISTWIPSPSPGTNGCLAIVMKATITASFCGGFFVTTPQL